MPIIPSMVDSIDSMPSLSQLIGAASGNNGSNGNGHAASEGDPAAQPPAAPANLPGAPPSLSDLMGSVTPQPEPAKPANPPSAAPVQPPAAAAPEPQPEPETPSAFELRKHLHSTLGIDPSEFSSDEEAFNELASVLQEAGTVLTDETYQQYQEQRDAFQKFLESQNQPPAQPQQPEVKPAAPSSLLGPAVSEDAIRLKDAGLITVNDDGLYVAKNPSLSEYAEEFNREQAAIRANALKIVRPGYIESQIDERLKALQSEEPEYVKELREQLADMQSKLTAREQQDAESELKTWRDTSGLKNEDGTLTPRGDAYVKAEQFVYRIRPDLHERAKKNDVSARREILKLATPLMEEFLSAQPQPQPQQPPAQKPDEPIVQRAARRAAPNGTGTNRLREFAGAPTP